MKLLIALDGAANGSGEIECLLRGVTNEADPSIWMRRDVVRQEDGISPGCLRPASRLKNNSISLMLNGLFDEVDHLAVMLGWNISVDVFTKSKWISFGEFP